MDRIQLLQQTLFFCDKEKYYQFIKSKGFNDVPTINYLIKQLENKEIDFYEKVDETVELLENLWEKNKKLLKIFPYSEATNKIIISLLFYEIDKKDILSASDFQNSDFTMIDLIRSLNPELNFVMNSLKELNFSLNIQEKKEYLKEWSSKYIFKLKNWPMKIQNQTDEYLYLNLPKILQYENQKLEIYEQLISFLIQQKIYEQLGFDDIGSINSYKKIFTQYNEILVHLNTNELISDGNLDNLLLSWEQIEVTKAPLYQEIIHENIIKDQEVYSGIKNEGVSCYVNSVIQVLFQNLEFQKQIFSVKLNSSNSFTSLLKQTFQALAFSPYQFIEIKQLNQIIQNQIFKNQDKNLQQDVDEFQKKLFDEINLEIYGKNQNDTLQGFIKQIFLIPISKTYFDYQDSAMTKFLESGECNQTTMDQFILNDFNYNFFTAWQMSLYEGYIEVTNEQTKESRYRKQISKIQGFPQQLQFCLGRFLKDKKINDSFEFPFNFDLNEFKNIQNKFSNGKIYSQIQEKQKLIKFFSNQKFEQQQNLIKFLELSPSQQLLLQDIIFKLDQIIKELTQESNDLIQQQDIEINSSTQENYYLQSVIIHQGSSLSFGHYYCYVKDFNKNQWYLFNDKIVKAVSEQDVKDDAYSQQNFSENVQVRNAYKIVYVNENEVKKLKSQSYLQKVRDIMRGSEIKIDLFKENEEYLEKSVENFINYQDFRKEIEIVDKLVEENFPNNQDSQMEEKEIQDQEKKQQFLESNYFKGFYFLHQNKELQKEEIYVQMLSLQLTRFMNRIPQKGKSFNGKDIFLILENKEKVEYFEKLKNKILTQVPELKKFEVVRRQENQIQLIVNKNQEQLWIVIQKSALVLKELYDSINKQDFRKIFNSFDSWDNDDELSSLDQKKEFVNKFNKIYTPQELLSFQLRISYENAKLKLNQVKQIEMFLRIEEKSFAQSNNK